MGNYLRRLVLAGLTVVAAGFAHAAEPVYVDAVDYPAPSEGWAAFEDLQRRLHEDFDDICGDTFCGGDYSDIRPLRLRCSVALSDGQLGQCLWTFAASELSVEPHSGRILVDNRTWRCSLLLPRQLTLPVLLQVLAVKTPLFEPLPGGAPVYDSLIDCL